MKLKVQYFLCYILLVTIINAQNIDTLLLELSKAENDNNKTTQIELCKSIGESYHKDRGYASAVFYYTKALSLDPDRADRLHFYKKIGQVYVDSTNYGLAIDFLNQAIKINQKTRLLEEYPGIYNLIGMCHGLTNNLDEAIVLFTKGLDYNIELNDSSGMGLSFYNIGLANHFKGLYDKAVENYIKSANLREAQGDTVSFVTSMTSIGEVFRLKEEYNKAENYYTKALKYKSVIDRKEILAYLYSELALVNKIQKQYDNAFAYIDTAMNYCVDIGYKRGITTLLSYKAGINQNLGNVDEAISLYKETISGYDEIGFEQGIVQSNINLAEIYFDKKQYREATKLLESIGDKAKKNSLLDECTQIAELKYKINKATGDNTVALLDLENFIVLKDSLLNIQKEEKILEVETKYQTAEKQKQIALLDKENKIKEHKINSRNYLLLLLVTIILFVIVLAISLIKRRKIHAELEIEKNRHKLLRSQMNPHFIYNALSAIQNFILQNNPLDSVTYISEFSALMRMVLESARNDLVLLEDDIKLVKSYLTLQQLRFDNKFEFEVVLDENINPELTKIPPMLSQPFIENAVEHGMRNKSQGDGKIKVRYILDSSNLIVTIEDNGDGILSDLKVDRKKHKSLATQISKERIENIKKILNMNIIFNINTTKQTGTTVEFKIPQKKVKL